MEKVLLRLKIEFLFVILFAVLLIGFYECGIWEEGSLILDGSWGYLVRSASILLTLCCIPMALKLLRLKVVKKSLLPFNTISTRNYLRWCEVRLSLLAVPLYLNLALYYATMETMGAYCSLILTISLIFCWPSADKVDAELLDTE